MRVLIGMETSGAIRDRLLARGVEAYSVDLLESDTTSANHIKEDIFYVLKHDTNWTWAIFHPDCTYLTNSAAWAYKDGPYHQKVKPNTLVGQARREAREKALEQVRLLMSYTFPLAIENPVGAISTAICKPTQIIQPYQFGDDASKATCLWLQKLPKLVATSYVPPRIVNGKNRWSNQTDTGQNKLSPSSTRWKERSKTYPGIAEAIVSQWCAHFEKNKN
jgi:hypothetical protein